MKLSYPKDPQKSLLKTKIITLKKQRSNKSLAFCIQELSSMYISLSLIIVLLSTKVRYTRSRSKSIRFTPCTFNPKNTLKTTFTAPTNSHFALAFFLFYCILHI